MVAAREEKILELYRRGVRHYQEIAKVLGVHPRVVRKDLGRIRARLVREVDESMRSVIIAHEVDEINFWTRELAGAWAKSKQDHEETTVVSGGKEGDKRTVKRYAQCGNPAYPSLILAFKARRAQLLGLDALPNAERKRAEAETTKSIMEIMRLADTMDEANVVDIEPLMITHDAGAGDAGADDAELPPSADEIVVD
jgi:hypothetical protein